MPALAAQSTPGPAAAGSPASQRSATPRALGLFGCPLDTGNRGVSALGLSLVHGLRQVAPGAEITLFDYGRGVREARLAIGEEVCGVRLVGAYHTRRLHRPESLLQLRAFARAGLSRLHPRTALLRGLDAVLDISGGDSFSDLYGASRFAAVAMPKLLALELGLPLVLAPQTYGPFREARHRGKAASILRRARAVWARDPRSFEVVRSLLGAQLDPQRHRSGVDVAFGLPARAPADTRLRDALAMRRERAGLLLGLNVSGLLYHASPSETAAYGLRCDYRSSMHTLLKDLLALPEAQIVLVPHVRSSGPDCDEKACADVHRALSPRDAERVLLLPATLEADEVKWAIGRIDWFCGTRMHACIAALSQGVPTAALAYSDKTLGVFETAGVGEGVVDPRVDPAPVVLARIREELAAREARAAALQAALPALQQRWQEQFEAMVAGAAA